MSHENPSRKRSGVVRLALASALALGALAALPASAQVPARFYWKTLSGANAVPLIFNSISGNTNPFDPAHLRVAGGERRRHARPRGLRAHLHAVRPGGDGRRPPADGAALGRGLGRPAGRSARRPAGSATRPSSSTSTSSDRRRRRTSWTSCDTSRASPSTSSPTSPCRSASTTTARPLNLGQNRWYGRLGFPVVWQLGSWVPGRRTTLELLPAVWLFGPNDDYVGKTLETDPLFQVDAHLTRDFTEHFWGSLDGVWYTGGAATIDGVEGEKLEQPGGRADARLPGQRQPGPHRRLQVHHRRQGSRGPPDGRVHGLGGLRLALHRRRRPASGRRVAGTS